MTVPLPFGEQALAACVDVLRQVTPDALDRPTPCTEFTVRELGEHLTRSMVLLGGIAGRELTAPADASLAEYIDLLGRGALEAWRERGTDGEVAVGRTITPAPLAADIVVLELVVHGWDFGRAIGSAYIAGDELCDHLIVQAAQLITDDKRGRGFAAATEVAGDAPCLERLIAFTGRTP